MGGGLGAVTRFAVDRGLGGLVGGRFPWGTLTVNLLGCLAVGLLYGSLVARPGEASPSRLLLGVGFLGGFTTFSAFGWQTVTLLREDAVALALLNVALSTVLGLVLVWVGWRLAR